MDRKNIKLEIWERGAGYTLASGSSSSAAAAVARKLDWCDRELTVHMPGGTLQIIVQADFQIIMKGGVTKVCEGKQMQNSSHMSFWRTEHEWSQAYRIWKSEGVSQACFR